MLHYPCALSRGGEVWPCLEVKPIQMSPEALWPAGSASARDRSSTVHCEWAGTLLMEHWVTRGVKGRGERCLGAGGGWIAAER